MECQIGKCKCLKTSKLIPDSSLAFQYERIIRDLKSELNRCISGEKNLTPEEEKSLRKELNDAITMYNRYT